MEDSESRKFVDRREFVLKLLANVGVSENRRSLKVVSVSAR